MSSLCRRAEIAASNAAFVCSSATFVNVSAAVACASAARACLMAARNVTTNTTIVAALSEIPQEIGDGLQLYRIGIKPRPHDLIVWLETLSSQQRELEAFRELADVILGYTAKEIAKRVEDGALFEIEEPQGDEDA